MIADRIKQSLLEFARSALSGVDYLGKYDAKIVSQTGDGLKVDVQPLDPRLPGMKNIALRNGLPDTVCKVTPGGFVLIGWDGGDPTKPYAVAGWKDSGSTEFAIGGSGAQFVALSNLVATELNKIKTAIETATAAGGGATLVFPTPYVVGSVAAQKVKAA